MCINIRCRYGRGRGGKQLIYFSSGSIQNFEMNELDSPIHLFNRNSTIRWESKGPGPKGPEPKGPESKEPRSIRWTDHVSTQSTIGTSEHSFKSVYEGR